MGKFKKTLLSVLLFGVSVGSTKSYGMECIDFILFMEIIKQHYAVVSQIGAGNLVLEWKENGEVVAKNLFEKLSSKRFTQEFLEESNPSLSPHQPDEIRTAFEARKLNYIKVVELLKYGFDTNQSHESNPFSDAVAAGMELTLKLDQMIYSPDGEHTFSNFWKTLSIEKKIPIFPSQLTSKPALYKDGIDGNIFANFFISQKEVDAFLEKINLIEPRLSTIYSGNDERSVRAREMFDHLKKIHRRLVKVLETQSGILKKNFQDSGMSLVYSYDDNPEIHFWLDEGITSQEFLANLEKYRNYLIQSRWIETGFGLNAKFNFGLTRMYDSSQALQAIGLLLDHHKSSRK